jgi:hypothetical protein
MILLLGFELNAGIAVIRARRRPLPEGGGKEAVEREGA